MQAFFLLLELFMYGLALYIAFRKDELAICFLPVIFFADTVLTEHRFSAMIYYGLVSFVLLVSIWRNGKFLQANLFTVIILAYFGVLLGKSTDLVKIREDLFNVTWFFLSIPLITTIFKKYSREDILNALSRSSTIILIIFIANVAFCSYYKYDVYSMYGITSGILYGDLYATDFNILSIALFCLLLSAVRHRNIFQLLVAMTAIIFIALSLRRSVIAIAGLGMMLVTILYFIQNIRNAIVLAVIMIFAGGFVITKTNVLQSFQERLELRNLEERSLDEEKRLFEYQLLYKDMFVHNRYSPWVGYGLFDSAGNYGNGQFYDRSLHGDITSILHSSGIVGLLLYFLMIGRAFYMSARNSFTFRDKVIIFFSLFAFVTYTLTGRFTQVGCMYMIMLVMSIPLAYQTNEETVDEGEPIEPQIALS